MSVRKPVDLLVDDSIISTTISHNNDEYQLYARTLTLCCFPYPSTHFPPVLNV